MGFPTLPINWLCQPNTDYFKDPVSLDCDHNFCRACITQCWEGSQTASCPECRMTIPKGNLKLNRQLANIVKAFRGGLQSVREAQTQGLCKKHSEPVKLFCKEDEIPIWVVRDRSKKRRDHPVIPAEEVAEEFKV
uniref:RING-type domain-containing protein n=1 Tax=Pelusios castaneus TaxID=367368 RepID=A0A8C8VKG3_9SAUR